MAIDSTATGSDSTNPPVAATLDIDTAVTVVPFGTTPHVEVTGTPQARRIKLPVIEGKEGKPGKDGEDGQDGADSTVAGPTGPPVRLSVGTVAASDSPDGADVDIVEDAEGNAQVSFVLPRGQEGKPGKSVTGPPGRTATVQVYNVTTLPFDQPAQITNRGDEHDALLDFAIPRGGTGLTGRGFTWVGPWAPFTNYEVDFIVSTGGRTYRRKTAGFSGATFDATEAAKWDLWADKGADSTVAGPPGPVGITWRGPWTPNTTYAVLDATSVVRPGATTRSTIVAKTAHTSGVSYTAAQESNWDLAAEGGQTLTQALTASIASVLNIGAGSGQNHFSLQTGPTPPGDGTVVNSATIAQGTLASATYVPPAEVTVTPDGKRVSLYTRVDSPVTSGSSYPRCEFRENGLTGSVMQMDPAVGTHYLRGRFRITHLPLKNGGVKPEVVLVQLHNNNNDVMAIRTQVVVSSVDGSRSLHLVLRVNGTASGAVRFKSPPVIGQEYDYMIRLVEGTAYVHFADVANPSAFVEPVFTTDPFQRTGDTKGTNALGYSWGFTSGSTPATAGTETPAWYFKFGQYLQTNALIETANSGAPSPYNVPQRRMYSINPADTVIGDGKDFFSVDVSRIQHWHTGWPQPQYLDYGAAVPGPAGPDGASATIAIGSVTPLPPGATPTASNSGSSTAAILDLGLPAGPAASVSVGNTTTGAEGSNAQVNNSGSTSNAILNFVIPRGATGGTGPGGTIAIRTVSTGAEGSQAVVTNYGTAQNAVLDISIPRGATGITGRTPAIFFGPTLTGASGTQASISSSTAANGDVTMTLTIPQGPKGDPGGQSLYVQQTSPGNTGRPYLWYRTDSSGKVVQRLLDDGKG